MNSVGLRLISCIALSALAFGFTACGGEDDDNDTASVSGQGGGKEEGEEPEGDKDPTSGDKEEPTEGDGEPMEGAGPAESEEPTSEQAITLETGIEGQRALTSLETSEILMICDAVEEVEVLLVDSQCKLFSAFAAAFESQTDAEFKTACEALTAQCITEAMAAEGECNPEPVPDTCAATIADFESCTAEQLSALSGLGLGVDCDQPLATVQASLLTFELSPEDGGNAEAPSAACAALETCEEPGPEMVTDEVQ